MRTHLIDVELMREDQLMHAASFDDRASFLAFFMEHSSELDNNDNVSYVLLIKIMSLQCAHITFIYLWLGSALGALLYGSRRR